MPILPDRARLGRSASRELRPLRSPEAEDAGEIFEICAILGWLDTRTP
jgi:hypothetical protein